MKNVARIRILKLVYPTRRMPGRTIYGNQVNIHICIIALFFIGSTDDYYCLVERFCPNFKCTLINQKDIRNIIASTVSIYLPSSFRKHSVLLNQKSVYCAENERDGRPIERENTICLYIPAVLRVCACEREIEKENKKKNNSNTNT